MNDRTDIMPGSTEYGEIAQWLYKEAAILDRNGYKNWLTLLDENIIYRMPVRSAVLPKDGDGFDDDMGFFVENYASLSARVGRLSTDQAWSDQPLSHTRHFVSNILAQRSDNEYHVSCAFMISRIRSDTPYDFFTGERRDVIIRDGDNFKLRKRDIFLDQTILKSHNLSILF